jgi:hypothetical protein
MTAARRSVVVYDAFWSTAGGGESYAAGVAEALSAANDVTLLGHEPVDTRWLGERLGYDLSGVDVAVVDPTEPLEVATAGYDVLVNASYRSHGRNGAARGLYVVHFPYHPAAVLAPWQRRLLDLSGRWRRGRRARAAATVSVVPQRGFHHPDVIRWQQVRWTDGDGRLRVTPPPHPDGHGAEPGPTTLHLWFGRYVPGGEARHITIEVDGVVVAGALLRPPASRLEVVEPLRVDVPLPAGPADVRIVSSAGVADEVLGNGDRRRLGVPLVGVTIGRGIGDAVEARASLLAAGPPDLGFLDTYDAVVANSHFTERWIERWWQRPSRVVEPPVSLREPGQKAPVILSVGRFFAPGRGHAKKQLEMVRAFRRCAVSLPGWELHLLGGCSPEDRPYLEQVRAEADDLPVVLHVDASGAELAELYARASIYWHATGLGEDLDADPVRAEHFGIAVVEAMSAGAVPIVLDAGGPAEVVRPGQDGWWFRDLDGLVASTLALVGDPVTMAAMSTSARYRAAAYGRRRFAGRFTELVDEVVAGVDPGGRLSDGSPPGGRGSQ